MNSSNQSAILLCQIGFESWGGSEIVSLELIEWFTTRGWRVDLFTTAFGAPIAEAVTDKVEAGSLRVVTLGSDHELDAHAYELIWVNQSLIPRSIVAQLANDPVTTPVVWHHMSSFQHLGLPLLYEVEHALASVITCMAPVAQDRMREYGFPGHDIELFDNPAPDEFVFHERRIPRSALRTILVVSNHPPVELRDAAAILAARGIVMEFAGLSDSYGRITPQRIAKHDAVVTIGKTTQYALVMGVPVYSYDHFGGGGWILEKNLESEWYGNFAGRIARRVLSAEHIAEELEQGFGSAQAFAQASREASAGRWSLTRQLETMLADSRLARAPRSLNAGQVRLADLQCAMRDELWGALRQAQRDVRQLRGSVDHPRETVRKQEGKQGGSLARRLRSLFTWRRSR